MSKLLDRIKLELRCWYADATVPNRFVPNCFGRKPKSFYIRYTKEEQQKILEKEAEEIRKTLESLPEQVGVPVKKDRFFNGRKEIIGYKFYDSTNNSEDPYYIEHTENAWIKDKTDSPYGLFFFTDLSQLMPYSKFGDKLVEIRIRRRDFGKMNIREHGKGSGVQEFSCYQYYVTRILDIRDNDTLKLIATNASVKNIANLQNVLKQLALYGVTQEQLNTFISLLPFQVV